MANVFLELMIELDDIERSKWYMEQAGISDINDVPLGMEIEADLHFEPKEPNTGYGGDLELERIEHEELGAFTAMELPEWLKEDVMDKALEAQK